MSENPLHGLRVVDIGTGTAAAYCSRLLADFGADVVKLEDLSVSGDAARHDGPAVVSRDTGTGDSALFAYLNQNKRGVAVDMQTERGQQIWRRLVFGADVVVDSGETAFDSRRSVSFADIETANPNAIVVSITPFGQSGPYSGRPACHLTISALGGLVKSLGDPAREPTDVGFPLLDYVSGVIGAIGALASWRARKGGTAVAAEFVDVSQQDVALRMAFYPTIMVRLGLPATRRNFFPMYVMAQNGYAAVNALSAQHWQDACMFMGLEDVAEDPAMADGHARMAAAPSLQPRMDSWAADMTREEIFELGQAMRIPAGIPYTLNEVVEEEHYNERGFFRTLQTNGGAVKQPAGPLGSRVTRDDWRDAPAIGEHTAEVMAEWLDDDATSPPADQQRG